jgi:hypothetical protein
MMLNPLSAISGAVDRESGRNQRDRGRTIASEAGPGKMHGTVKNEFSFQYCKGKKEKTKSYRETEHIAQCYSSCSAQLRPWA